MITPIQCPHCGQNLPLPTEAKGRLARCPVCREIFHIPRIWLPLSLLKDHDRKTQVKNQIGPGLTVKILMAGGSCCLGCIVLIVVTTLYNTHDPANDTRFEKANLIEMDSHTQSLADAYIQQRALDDASREIPEDWGNIATWSPSKRNEPVANLVDLVDLVEPAVVRINTFRANRKGTASGFVVHASGVVITNYHVIHNVEFAHVEFKDGRITMIDGALALAPEKDLAVLKLSPSTHPIPPLPLAPETPRKGEDVAAFGAPLDFSFSMTKGIVSGLRTSREMRNVGILTNVPWIQTDASISEGNSGGPLVNMRGEVVGVNAVTSQNNAQNLNFAIAVEAVREVLEQASGPLIPLGNNLRK